VYSSDGQNLPDVIGAFGASAATHISDIPFDGPMSQVRVGRVDGEFIINPTLDELENSDIDIIVAGTADSVLMIEGEMKEITEAEMLEAIKEGHKSIAKLCQFQEELREECGVDKREYVPEPVNEALKAKVEEHAGEKLKEIIATGLGKEEYTGQLNELKNQIIEEITSEEEYENASGDISDFFGDIEKRELRNMILEKKRRIDGRSPEDIRDIWTEVGYLPRAHGSSIFTRGETQALVSIALGTKRDAQSVDTLFYEEEKTFMLHYNFPPYCVGEAGFLRGPGRREIGHGHLAERALKMLMPEWEDFGYVVRV
jgi:polyribonucleotide nucleotidyltransferase